VHSRGWRRPDPGVPVVLPERVSRREARAARKKLKQLRGDWKDMPAADRLVLRATADARDTLRTEVGVALLVTLIVAVAGAAIAYGVVELGPAIRAATGAGTRGWFVYARGGSTGWVEPAVFLLLGSAVIVALLRYGPVRYVRRRLRDRQIRRDPL
jgi:hypothetical protein